MPVNTTDNLSGPYQTNGVTVTFPFSFVAPSAAEVAVMLRDSNGTETSASGFVVALSAGPGGSVTFAVAPEPGYDLFVLLDPAFTQEIAFENGSAWLAEPVNEAADRSALRDLALKRDVDRGLRVPLGESAPQVLSLEGADGQALGIVGGSVAPVPYASGAAADAEFSRVGAEAAFLAAKAARVDANADAAAAKDARASAEAAAGAALAATASGPAYPSAALDYVPQGAALGAVAVTNPGATGTNGTFALAWTGGNFDVDPVGTFTVAGGVLTAVTITQAGLYIGDAISLPTPDFSASAGLAGATAPISAAYRVASGSPYWAADASDPDYLLLVLNNLGVAEPVTPEVKVPLANVVSGVIADLTGIAGNFRDADARNLYDPAATGNLRGKLINTGSGAINNSDLWLGIAITNASCVVGPNKTYTALIYAAPPDWGFYVFTAAAVHIYQADGVTWHSAIAIADCTFDGAAPPNSAFFGVRRITFTTSGSVPVGARLRFNVRTGETTAEGFVALCAALVVVESASPIGFIPHAPAGTRELALAAPSIAPVNVFWRDQYCYVRTARAGAPDKDIVQSLRIDPPSVGLFINRASGVDFVESRVIAKATALAQTIDAFGAPDLSYRQSLGSDEWTPERIFGKYYGYSHGVIGYARLGAHSKTNADIGQIHNLTDGVTTQPWVLAGIFEQYISSVSPALTKVLLMVPRYSGTDADYDFNRDLVKSANPVKFTHVSGGTDTADIGFTKPAVDQSESADMKWCDLRPVMRDYDRTMFVDGVEIAKGEEAAGGDFRIFEHFDILNVAKQQDWLIANVGTATPPDYTNDDISSVLGVTRVHIFNAFGFVEAITTIEAKEAYKLRIFDYLNGQQQIRMGLNTLAPDKLRAWSPGHATYGSAPVISDAPAEDYLLHSEYADPENPARFVTQLLTNSADVFQHGYYAGKDLEDDGILADSNALALISAPMKTYLHMVNSLGVGETNPPAREIAAGTVFQFSQARGSFTCFDQAIRCYAFPTHGGRDYFVLGLIGAVSNLWCPMPHPMLAGRRIRVVDGDGGITLNTRLAVTESGINVSSVGGGWIAVELVK